MILKKERKSIWICSMLISMFILILLAGCSLESTEELSTEELSMDEQLTENSDAGMKSNSFSYIRPGRIRPRYFRRYLGYFGFENGLSGWKSTFTNAKINTKYDHNGSQSVEFHRAFWKIIKMEVGTPYELSAWFSRGKINNSGKVQIGIKYLNKYGKTVTVLSPETTIIGHAKFGKVSWVQVKFSFTIYEDRLLTPTTAIPIPTLIFILKKKEFPEKNLLIDDVILTYLSD